MVLSAQHKGNGKKMALKIAPITSKNLSSANSLKTEMGILQKLNHDNIIKVYNSVET
jgi:serine/threonine protein kinase